MESVWKIREIWRLAGIRLERWINRHPIIASAITIMIVDGFFIYAIAW